MFIYLEYQVNGVRNLNQLQFSNSFNHTLSQTSSIMSSAPYGSSGSSGGGGFSVGGGGKSW